MSERSGRRPKAGDRHHTCRMDEDNPDTSDDLVGDSAYFTVAADGLAIGSTTLFDDAGGEAT